MMSNNDELISKSEVIRLINVKFENLEKQVRVNWKGKLVQEKTLIEMLRMLCEKIDEEVVNIPSEVCHELRTPVYETPIVTKQELKVEQKPVVKKNEFGFVEIAFPKSF